MIRAGELNQRLRFQRPKVATNGIGETIPAYGKPGRAALDEIRVWGSVRAMSGAEKTRNGITSADTIYRVQVRHKDELLDPSQAWRIAWRGHTLEIDSAIPSEDGASIIVTAHESVAVEVTR